MPIAHAPVVVGVDGTTHGDAALKFALDDATRHGAELEAITAWGSGHMTEDQANLVQAASLARVLSGRHHLPTIRARVIHGAAGPVLVEAARHSRLLVVGSRSGSSRVNSVSSYCTTHFSGPLTIVPDLAG